MSNIINDHKTQDEQKIPLTIAINFLFSKDSKEMCIMHSKSQNIESLIVSKTDEITKAMFDSFLQNYEKGLEEQMKRGQFVFDSVDLLY